MLDRLPEDVRALLESVGRLAPGGAWLVGGPVRDLMLGRPFDDIDVCVDTPAGELADRLCAEHGGTVQHHESFATATWRGESLAIDLATTRRERYPEPAALPEVEPAPLEEDLARRDFTVNCMALDLSPSGWDTLVDPHGGRQDLEARRLRVLHERSFIDDPTRAFRGVRFSVRLGFALEPTAPGPVERLSAARLGRELRLIFDESDWSALAASIERLRLLEAVEPGWSLAGCDWAGAEAAAGESAPGDPASFGLLLLIVAAPPDRRDALATRIEARKALRRAAEASVAAEHGLTLVRGRPSALQLHDLLGSFDPTAIRALALTGVRPADVLDYLERRRRAEPRATSRQLLEAGIARGPAMGRARTVIERARIERPELSLEDELEIARGLA